MSKAATTSASSEVAKTCRMTNGGKNERGGEDGVSSKAAAKTSVLSSGSDEAEVKVTVGAVSGSDEAVVKVTVAAVTATVG